MNTKDQHNKHNKTRYITYTIGHGTQHDKHDKGVMRSHWKRQPFVLTLKNATCPRKICQNTKFCAKFVKFTPGKILQKYVCGL